MSNTEQTTEAVVIDPKQFGLDEVKANEIKGGLTTIIEERTILSEKYMEVVQMDVDSPDTSKIARELRLKIKDNRTKGIEAWHKVNKEFYLRGGQFVDAIKKKEVAENERMEDALSQIENHYVIKLKEQQDKLHNERIAIIEPYVDSVAGLDFRTMEEDVFQAYLSAKKSAYDEKIRLEQEEAERIARENAIKELHNARKEQLVPLWNYITEKEQSSNFGEISDEDFDLVMKDAIDRKSKKDEEERLHQEENERLKKEAEAREKLIEERSKLMMPYVQFIQDFNKMLTLEEDKFNPWLDGVKEIAEKQWEAEKQEQLRKQKEADDLAKKQAKEKADADAKLKKEQEEKAKLQKELDDKKEAEAKELKEKAEAEAKAKKEAEKLAKAPIKKQLDVWVDSFELPPFATENETSKLIFEKFEAFKKWSKSEIEKI